jgi:hypothetical protein
MTGFKQNKLEQYCDFDIEVIYNEQQPIGFEDWSKLITYEKCRITLPDNSSIDIRMYIDLNGLFDNYDFTNFLVNRFKEII